MNIQMIPLDKLYPSAANVRRTGTKDGIEELAKSIHVHGLLNNLVVQPGGAEGSFSVLAGGRRHAALNHLVKGKLLPADWPVPCNVIEIEGDISSEEISLAENEMRQAMHPADQFEAFKKLADEGQGNDTIAAKFGVTPRVVEQRLKLARVSPKLVKAYRDEEMSLEQLMAFTVSTDHKQQDKIWKELPKYAKEQRRSDPILRAITDKHIPIDNDLAAFVGIEAYEKAGGQVLRDLFAEEGGEAYFTNAGLLDKLAAEKLEQIAEDVRAEGWKWVSVIPDLSWDEERKYTKRQAKHSHSPEQKAKAAELRKEIAALEKQYPDDDENDRPIEIEDQLSNLDDEATAAEEGNEVWTAKDKELAGAIVTIDGGKSKIMRGMMTVGEAKAVQSAAKKKANAKSGDKKEEAGLSQALIHDLTSHRTMAMQAKMPGSPKIALVALLHSMIPVALQKAYWIEGCAKIKPEKLEPGGADVAKSVAAKEAKAAISKVADKIPAGGKLWPYLMKQDTKDLLEILAACVAPTIDAVLSRDPGKRGDEDCDNLAAALKLDMADYWEATEDSYFGRVSKDLVIEAVTEACGKPEAAKLAGMKKGEAVKAAAKLMKGKGWLPSILRGAA